MKKIIALVAACSLMVGLLVGCGNSKKDNGEIVVYNWGEYIDPEVIEMFEKETGISVVYDEFETNEEMYPKVESGAIKYDLICPSDYMIQKMVDNDMLAEINFDNVPNIKNIGDRYIETSKAFDPENKYSIPYMWGTVGILYNKTMIKEGDTVDSWAILWDEDYSGSIIMQKSVRDAFAVALKADGHSLNSTDKAELEQAKEKLLAQKPLVQAYYIDEVRDAMIAGDAALAVIYSGEALYTQDYNEDLEYVVPKEGSNIWIDSWVIPKNCNNKEGAEAFLNFLCRDDIAKMNFEYITYSTPNDAAKALLDEDLQNNKTVFPDEETIKNQEVFNYLGEEMESYYNSLWKEVRGE